MDNFVGEQSLVVAGETDIVSHCRAGSGTEKNKTETKEA